MFDESLPETSFVYVLTTLSTAAWSREFVDTIRLSTGSNIAPSGPVYKRIRPTTAITILIGNHRYSLPVPDVYARSNWCRVLPKVFKPPLGPGDGESCFRLQDSFESSVTVAEKVNH